MKPLAELHKEALEQFEEIEEEERAERLIGVEDLLFLASPDGQWTDEAKDNKDGHVRFTIDRISAAKDQIVGDQRETRTSIKINPKKNTTKGKAEILSGLIRGIEQTSRANNAYDNAFDESITCGWGGWRVVTEYEDENPFNDEQTISIAPIESAVSSLYFGPSKEWDKRDAPHAFLITEISQKQFKKDYPDASIIDFSVAPYANSVWFKGEKVRLAEYWWKEPVKRTFAQLSDGRVIDLDKDEDIIDELAEQVITIEDKKTVDSHIIYMAIMNGAEFLTEPQEWAGKFFPLIPVFGKQQTVNGKRFTWGIVRKAKDPQRILNYATSTAVEVAALSPKDPIFYTAANVADFKKDWENYPAMNIPFLGYTPDPKNGGIQPARAGAPAVQTALLEQIRQAREDIHTTTGMEPASLGNVPELKSGKAIIAQQKMGDRGSFIYSDNLQKAKQYTGEILVDLISKIYDTLRIVKIIGPDEKLMDIEINKPATDNINQPIIDKQTGKQIIVNDVTIGEYEVISETGPSYSTKRQETANQLITLAGQSPTIQELALDLIIDNMDLNKGDEIGERVRRKMIKDGVIEPTPEEIKKFKLDQVKPDPMNAELVENLKAQTEQLRYQIAKLIAETENKEADTQAKIIAAQKDSVQAFTLALDALLKKKGAGFSLTGDELDLLKGQEILVQETVGETIALNELAQSKPIGKPQPMKPGMRLPISQQQLPNQPESQVTQQSTSMPNMAPVDNNQ
jgi:hypothetical protein